MNEYENRKRLLVRMELREWEWDEEESNEVLAQALKNAKAIGKQTDNVTLLMLAFLDGFKSCLQVNGSYQVKELNGERLPVFIPVATEMKELLSGPLRLYDVVRAESKKVAKDLLAVSRGEPELDQKLRMLVAYSEGWEYGQELMHMAGVEKDDEFPDEWLSEDIRSLSEEMGREVELMKEKMVAMDAWVKERLEGLVAQGKITQAEARERLAARLAAVNDTRTEAEKQVELECKEEWEEAERLVDKKLGQGDYSIEKGTDEGEPQQGTM